MNRLRFISRELNWIHSFIKNSTPFYTIKWLEPQEIQITLFLNSNLYHLYIYQDCIYFRYVVKLKLKTFDILVQFSYQEMLISPKLRGRNSDKTAKYLRNYA